MPRTLLVAILLLAAGCSAAPRARAPLPALDLEAARSRPLFDGRSGERIGFEELLLRCADADVIVIGELHDDPGGHAFQAAVVEELVAEWPGAALSMEMLERDEQPFVDDYLDGIIDRDQFLRRAPLGWSGGEQWTTWYQPMVDTTREADGVVVAANAPRRYVRQARREGYEVLEVLPEPRRSMFAIPEIESGGRYLERFRAFVAGRDPDEAPTDEDDDVAAADADDAEERDEAEIEAAAEEAAAFEERVASVFRSQSLWDATMADSIARAWRDGAPKVVHLVGQFHSDYDGGLVQQLRHLAPELRILVVSMQRGDADELREDDRDRADAVVYTGG